MLSKIIIMALDSFVYYDNPWDSVPVLEGLIDEPHSNRKEPIQHKVQCFETNNHIGVKVDGSIIIPPQYERIKLIPLLDGRKPFFLAAVSKTVNNKMKCGLLSDLNEIIQPIVYDNIRWWVQKDGYFSCCYAIKLKQDRKTYCCDIGNDFSIIEIDNYSHIDSFVSLENNYYSKKYRDYIHDYISKIKWNNKRYTIVKKNGLYGMILNDGTVIVQPQFKKIEGFVFSFKDEKCDMRANVVFEDNVKGWIDYRGFLFGFIPAEHRSAKQISEDRYVVLNKEGKYGIIDASCNVVCPFVFDNYVNHESLSMESYLKINYMFFHGDNGWTIVDIRTGVLCSSYFDAISWHHSYEYCYVSKDNKQGVISVDGDVIIPCIYDKLSGFLPNNGASSAIYKGEEGCIINAQFMSNKEVRKDDEKNHHVHLNRKSEHTCMNVRHMKDMQEHMLKMRWGIVMMI